MAMICPHGGWRDTCFQCALGGPTRPQEPKNAQDTPSPVLTKKSRPRASQGPQERFDEVAWTAVSKKIIRRDRKCQRCSRRESLTVHHIVPRDEGGSNESSNLVALCTSCHDSVEMATAEGMPFAVAMQPPETGRYRGPKEVYRDKRGLLTVILLDEPGSIPVGWA